MERPQKTQDQEKKLGRARALTVMENHCFIPGSSPQDKDCSAFAITKVMVNLEWIKLIGNILNYPPRQKPTWFFEKTKDF